MLPILTEAPFSFSQFAASSEFVNFENYDLSLSLILILV
jgi:hypothetical protein